MRLTTVMFMLQRVRLRTPQVINQSRLTFNTLRRVFKFIHRRPFASQRHQHQIAHLAPVLFPQGPRPVVRNTHPDTLYSRFRPLRVDFNRHLTTRVTPNSGARVVIRPNRIHITRFDRVLFVTARNGHLPVASPSVTFGRLGAYTSLISSVIRNFRFNHLISGMLEHNRLTTVIRPHNSIRNLPFVLNQPVTTRHQNLANHHDLNRRRHRHQRTLTVTTNMKTLNISNTNRRLGGNVRRLFLFNLRALTFGARHHHTECHLRGHGTVQTRFFRITQITAINRRRSRRARNFIVPITRTGTSRIRTQTLRHRRSFTRVTDLIRARVNRRIINIQRLLWPQQILRVLWLVPFGAGH